jgi:hypothetical protein
VLNQKAILVLPTPMRDLCVCLLALRSEHTLRSPTPNLCRRFRSVTKTPQKNMTSPTPPPGLRVRYFLVSLLALSTAALTSAQQTAAPATAAAPSQEEEAIVLSPFTVDASKEQGYFAQNTLAG